MAETLDTGTTPEEIGYIYVGDNPYATAHNTPRGRQRMQRDIDELFDSEYGDQVVVGMTLDEAAAAADSADVIIPRTGDGGLSRLVTKLQQDNKYETAVLPGKYGNACDKAVAHVGEHTPLEALRQGRIENFWPIAVTLKGENSADNPIYGAGYVSLGATAEAVVDMDEARLGKLWKYIVTSKNMALAYEFGLSVRGLMRARPYDIIDSSGQRRSVYNLLAARNPIIAKKGKIPQVDPFARQLFVHEMPEKRLLPVASAMGKLALGRLDGEVTSDSLSFTVASRTYLQIDGDTWLVPPDTHVTIAPADNPLQVVTTRPPHSGRTA